jgi:hypothetical protein
MEELQIKREPKKLSKLFWKIQIVLRWVLFIILIAAFFGLFGPGILGQASISNKNMTIHYDKFLHVQNTSVLNFSINFPSDTEMKYIRLESSFDMYKKASLKSITPAPFFQSIEGDNIVFYFKKLPHTNILPIVIVFEPFTPGLLRQSIGVDDSNAEKLVFKQFIYP